MIRQPAVCLCETTQLWPSFLSSECGTTQPISIDSLCQLSHPIDVTFLIKFVAIVACACPYRQINNFLAKTREIYIASH